MIQNIIVKKLHSGAANEIFEKRTICNCCSFGHKNRKKPIDFVTETRRISKSHFFQNFIGCPTVQFLNCNVVNHRKGSLLIYFLPQKVLKTSLPFYLFLDFNNKIRAEKALFG